MNVRCGCKFFCYILMRLLTLPIVQSHQLQSNKNIAKKLATTTHIHLYNEFDLLRGKTNGAFDIAYNVGGDSTEFKESLKRFLQIMDLGEDISQKIYKSTMKALETAKTESEEKGVEKLI